VDDLDLLGVSLGYDWQVGVVHERFFGLVKVSGWA
jgi:hypothetical protein